MNKSDETKTQDSETRVSEPENSEPRVSEPENSETEEPETEETTQEEKKPKVDKQSRGESPPSESSTPPSLRTRLSKLRERIMPKMAGVRVSLRSVIMVALAGMAAYLTSVLLAIPLTGIIEPWVVGTKDLSVTQRVIYGALILDLPKILAGTIFALAFGFLMKIRAWASGIGILMTVYLADLGLSYVIGSFEPAWSNRYALMGRLPLAFIGVAIAAVAAIFAQRRERRREKVPEKPGKKSKPEDESVNDSDMKQGQDHEESKIAGTSDIEREQEKYKTSGESDIEQEEVEEKVEEKVEKKVEKKVEEGVEEGVKEGVEEGDKGEEVEEFEGKRKDKETLETKKGTASEMESDGVSSGGGEALPGVSSGNREKK